MSDKTDKYIADEKAFNDENDENEAKLVAISARYVALTAKMKPCLDKLPANPTDEMLHETCGQLWDGNSIHTNPVNQGTGSKMN